MERARATWTDERLDDLGRRVESGFERTDEGLRALSARIDAQRAELGARIDAQGAELSARIDAQAAETSRRFDALEMRIDALQRTMVQVGGGMTVAILATLLSVILTRA